MGAVRYAAFRAILITLISLQGYLTAANFTIPFFSPLFGDACRENICGKGKCVSSDNTTFGFQCECESGWRQARSDDDKFFKFLPCVIPNCTLDYKCADTPAPNNHKNASFSFFDPCFWAYCGGGTCNKTSLFSHTCECGEDYSNLFNNTAFPCYKKCTLGMDCANLGLNIMNSSSHSSPPPSPSSAGNSKSRGARLIPRFAFGWLFMASFILVLLK